MKLILLPSRRAYSLFPSVVLVALVAACGGSGGGPTAPTAAIQKTSSASGDAQTGAVSTALTSPLRVVVTLNGTPQVGTNVTWASSAVGSSISPGANTDANGIATANWTLGQTAGTETATATLTGATGSPVTFTATATPGPATQLILVSGNNQTGITNAGLASPAVVKAGDQFGNGVSGITVAWQVTSGAASITPPSGPTDATGSAQRTVTIGATSGSVTITAASSGLTNSPIMFRATTFDAAVTVGPGIAFKSVRNGSGAGAVDTIPVGGTVLWTWAPNSISHSVQSTGTPSFPSSGTQTSGTYTHTFAAVGTYNYNCVVHGSAMSGAIVVK